MRRHLIQLHISCISVNIKFYKAVAKSISIEADRIKVVFQETYSWDLAV